MKKHKKCNRFLSILIVAAVAMNALSVPSVMAEDAPVPSMTLIGSGTADAPYEISSKEDLLSVTTALNSNDSNYTGKSYKLTNDITLTESFPMITSFSGTLDGAGYSISGLVIDSATTGASKAAFIQTNSGTIKNLFMENVSVTGGAVGVTGNQAAGLVAANNGTVKACSVTGTITTLGWEQAAGLVANNGSTAVVSDCYFKGNVTALYMPGGIASYAKGTISRCYSDAVLTELSTQKVGARTTQQGNDAGIICAYPGSGVVITNCVAGGGTITMAYPNNTVSGFVGRILGYTGNANTLTKNYASAAITINNAVVTGGGENNQQGSDKTDTELQTQSTYQEINWDFTNTWEMSAETGRPALRKSAPVVDTKLNGQGTSSDPFLINNETDLLFWATQLNENNTVYSDKKYFSLTSNITLTKAFPMVNSFSGTLDGLGHSISGLSISTDVAVTNTVGFIKSNSGTIQNLTMKDVSITVTGSAGTGPMVAGLAADNVSGGTIYKCAVTGNISAPGFEKVAGIVAQNKSSTVQDCYFDGELTSKYMAGGIACYNNGNGTVSRCFVNAKITTTSTEMVSGRTTQQGNDAAGICAYPNTANIQGNVVYGGSLTYAYNQAGAATSGFFGRVIGYTAYNKTLSKNLANPTFTVNGQTLSGTASDPNGQDTSLENLQKQSTYEALGWNFDFTWKMDETLKHPVLQYVNTAIYPDRIAVTVNGDAKTRRGFSWYTTQDETQPVIKLSTEKDFSSVTEITADKVQLAGGNHYTAIAQSLKPSTTYYYRVGDKGSDIFSGIGTFTTASDSGAFSFINLTDTQANSDSDAQLSATTIAKALQTVPNASFVMHGGDYVEDGGNEAMWKSMLNLSQQSMLSTTFVPTAGNHDEDANTFINHFNVEKNGDTSKGSYYSFDYSNTHFAVLNTNEDGTQCITTAQLDWLRNDVNAARAKGAQWIVLNMHKGAYTTADHADDADIKAMRRVLVPLIDELNIDLVLEGHDHILSRTKVLKYDANGTECATPVETTQYTEIKGSKRIQYSVSPDGTIFFLSSTAGAKHYSQATAPNGIDTTAYFNLFDRTDNESTSQFFTGITIDGGRLDAMIYQITNDSAPFVWEGFGIDKEITPVIAAINALPAMDKLTLADKTVVVNARAAYNQLDSTQQGQVTNFDKLSALEAKLASLESSSSGTLQWRDATATARQSISVRNSTVSAFNNAPVLLRITNIPSGTDQKTLKFYGMDGLVIPYEVENWNPGGTTTVWVKLPTLPAKGNTDIIAYYGGAVANNDPTKVWNSTYELVEHFTANSASGSTRTDSTGKQTGTVSGDDLKPTMLDNGTVGEHFSNTKISYGDVGGGLDQVSVSAIYQVTGDDLTKTSGSIAPFFAKKLAESGSNDALLLGLNKTDKNLLATHIGFWFEANPNGMNKTEVKSALPQDGKPHLVTLTYDGMTVAAFVDGKRVFDTFAEYRTTPNGTDTPATIGSFSNIDEINSPFSGTLDEIQLSNYRVTPEWESFRYSNYFGDAVTCGTQEQKSSTGITLDIATPMSGSTAETGMIKMTGVVSKACSFTAELAGESFSCGTSDAGSFSILVPVNKTGEQTVKLTATSKDNAANKATDTVTLTLSDPNAPKKPIVSDSSVNGVVSGSTAKLSVKAVADDREKVTASFYSNAPVQLTAANTIVKAGTTNAVLPDAVKPTDGSASAELFPTSTATNQNPYQIYTITLNASQMKAPRFHLVWNGTAEREVTAYVYNTASAAWSKVGSAYDQNAQSVSINMDIPNENVLNGNQLSLLLWRGMTEKIDGRSSYVPTDGQFDFSFAAVPDSQLYAQSYPEYGTGQYQWIVDNAQKMKTKMVVQLGDLVNRPWLNQEYQWPCMDNGFKLLEAAKIPYQIAWGNHDYETGVNERIMYNKYFPVSRIQKAAGSLWGGAFSVDKTSPSDNTYCLMEQNGAKIMVITIGYWMSDADLSWAANVISQHPDYSVIVATHYYINGAGSVGNSNFYNKIVTPYKNVKLVICGHVGNTGYRYDKFSDHETYGILSDYQSLSYGGEGFLREMKFDVENNLVYFNTYSTSPLYSDKTQSPYGDGTYTNVNGGNLYQLNRDEFAIGLDLGGNTNRTLKTNSMSMAASNATQVGTNQTITGNGTASVELSNLTVNTPYEWYAVLTDETGNKTMSDTKYFSTSAQQASTVTTVVVAPATATVQTESTQTFSAKVNGTNNPSQNVTWSVSGNTSSSTTISGLGLLHVAPDEKASALTVKATSVADTTKSGTATVTVTPSPSTPTTSAPAVTPAPATTPAAPATDSPSAQTPATATPAVTTAPTVTTAPVVTTPATTSPLDKAPVKTIEAPVKANAPTKAAISRSDVKDLKGTDNVVAKLDAVKLTIPAGILNSSLGSDPNATLNLSVTKSTDKSNANLAKIVVKGNGMQSIAAYDISLTRVSADGTPTAIHELGGKVKVSIALTDVPANTDFSSLEIYYYNPTTGKFEAMHATYDKATNSLVFYTDHFSTYVIGKKTASTATSTGNPKTGDAQPFQIVVSILAIGVCMVAGAWIYRKKHRQNKA